MILGNPPWEEATVEELIEVANDPDPNWYEVAMFIVGLFDVNYDEFIFNAESPCSVWVEWSDENHLPTGTILKHMEVFFQLSVLRNIPPEKYDHLSPEGAQSILKPLLSDEPTVPATSCKISCPVEFVLQWWKWENRLLSALKNG